MIIDSNGNMFEDRRKKQTNRRKNECDSAGGRRTADRRKAPEQVTKKSK